MLRLLTSAGSAEESTGLLECFHKRHGVDLMEWIKEPKALQLHPKIHELLLQFLTSNRSEMDISSAVASEDAHSIREAATGDSSARTKFADTLSSILANRSADQLAFMCTNYARQYSRLPHEDIARGLDGPEIREGFSVKHTGCRRP